MNKFTKYMTFCVIFMLLMGSVAGNSTQSATTVGPRPISLQGPRGNIPLYQWLTGNILPIIYGMNDANFTNGDVLYSEFTTNDIFTQSMPLEHQNDSVNFDLTTFKTNLNNYISSHPLSPLKPMLQDLLSEIGSSSNLTVTKDLFMNPTKDIDQLSHFVIFLYDPDKSVINAMNDIRNNITLTTQSFTGDEVLTSVEMDRTIENIYGRFANLNIFKYGNGTLATKFMEFGQFLNFHPLIAHQLISDLNANDLMQAIRNFATPSYDKIISSLHGVKSVNLGFTVSQLQIANLTFTKKLNKPFISNFDATLVESNALGVTIYNDTNNNGIMDLTMKTINSNRPGFNGTVLPSGSNEALYRVDFSKAQNHNYTKVEKTPGQDELTFAFDATNVTANLNPVNQNQDESLISNDSSLSQTITDFGYKFHLTTNETDKSVNVKFDYNLGTWSNQSMLQGLSLNQMFLTGVKDFSAKQRIMALQNQNQTVNDGASAGSARKFAITAGQSQIASINLDQIPYTLNGDTQVNASGQTLPLLFTRFLFGSLTTNSNVIRTIGGSVTSTRYLYSISYPVFNGQSISHDPSFSMVSSGSNTNDSTSSVPKGVPGFEILSIAVLPIAIAIRKRT